MFISQLPGLIIVRKLFYLSNLIQFSRWKLPLNNKYNEYRFMKN